MIKYFRKIRQNLLSEGKAGKYFINTDYSLPFNHTFASDTLSSKIYSRTINYPYEITVNGTKRNSTIGFIPLDFEELI